MFEVRWRIIVLSSRWEVIELHAAAHAIRRAIEPSHSATFLSATVDGGGATALRRTRPAHSPQWSSHRCRNCFWP